MKNTKYIDDIENSSSWLNEIVSEGTEKASSNSLAKKKKCNKTVASSELVSIGYKLTEEHKKKIGAGNKGVSRKTAWLDRKHREDTKEKLRQFNLNRDPASYTYSAKKKSEISNKISAGKKGKKRSPEMMVKMAEQRAMNFKTPIGVFRDRSKAEKAYLELGHSKQDFKKLYMHQPDKFYFTTKAISV
nr:hypothetical protein [uncultured Polynucleobacter sp.]